MSWLTENLHWLLYSLSVLLIPVSSCSWSTRSSHQRTKCPFLFSSAKPKLDWFVLQCSLTVVNVTVVLHAATLRAHLKKVVKLYYLRIVRLSNLWSWQLWPIHLPYTHIGVFIVRSRHRVTWNPWSNVRFTFCWPLSRWSKASYPPVITSAKWNTICSRHRGLCLHRKDRIGHSRLLKCQDRGILWMYKEWASVHTDLHIFENNPLDTAVLLIKWTAFIGRSLYWPHRHN